MSVPLPAGIGVDEGPRGHAPRKFLEHVVICALRGGITNKIMLFALNQTLWTPPNFWLPPKFLGWLRYCLQGKVAKLSSGLFYCWSLSCNNDMATNIQMFTSSYDIRRFVACDF